MKRITVDVSDDMYRLLDEKKKDNGSSISFEANALMEWAIKEKSRKRKIKEIKINSDEYNNG